jgi:hypothetical protein
MDRPLYLTSLYRGWDRTLAWRRLLEYRAEQGARSGCLEAGAEGERERPWES